MIAFANTSNLNNYFSLARLKSAPPRVYPNEHFILQRDKSDSITLQEKVYTVRQRCFQLKNIAVNEFFYMQEERIIDFIAKTNFYTMSSIKNVRIWKWSCKSLKLIWDNSIKYFVKNKKIKPNNEITEKM